MKQPSDFELRIQTAYDALRREEGGDTVTPYVLVVAATFERAGLLNHKYLATDSIEGVFDYQKDTVVAEQAYNLQFHPTHVHTRCRRFIGVIIEDIIYDDFKQSVLWPALIDSLLKLDSVKSKPERLIIRGSLGGE